MTVYDAEGNVRFCGMPDNAVVELQAWEGMVTYGVLGDTLDSKVTASEQMADLDTALETWAEDSGLSITPGIQIDERTTDITLAYREGAHGDGQPFDAAGGVVGHAWFPPDGRIHHDNSERWTASYRTRVTLHEVGHALGLGHTPELGNIMYPYVTTQHELGPWDVQQIRLRYGAPAGEPPPEPPPSIPNPPMLLGIRRHEVNLDGEPVPDGLMVKIYAADGDTGEDVAESAYFEDGFFILEIPEVRRFSLQMRSPVESTWLGPWDWTSGVLVWLDGLQFDTAEPEEPEEPNWLPWRFAEARLRLGPKDADDVTFPLQIRFLNTRESVQTAPAPDVATNGPAVAGDHPRPDADGAL